jgi:hypothetical protein
VVDSFDNQIMPFPVITFSDQAGEAVDIHVGQGLDGLDTRDVTEQLWKFRETVREIRVDLPDGRHWTWLAQ